MLRVSYCDSVVFVVHHQFFALCMLQRPHFCPNIMKLGQNVCLDKISDELKNGSCPVENFVSRSNLR